MIIQKIVMAMDLKLIKIRDVKTDNERVVLKALAKCNLNEYVLFDSSYDENGIISNKHRHLFLFPNLVIEAGDFVWLYTKSGTYGTHSNVSNTITHKLYWGIKNHVWNNEGDKAYLLHYDDWSSLAYKNKD